MSSAAATFRDRIGLLTQVAGSRRALARWLGVADTALIAWESGSEPFNTTLRKVCSKTGLSMSWLRDGEGDAETELRKYQTEPKSDAVRVGEGPGDSLRENVNFILAHGKPGDVAMLEDILRGAANRIQSSRGD